jgi:predicted nuclease with TOPRIM domain
MSLLKTIQKILKEETEGDDILKVSPDDIYHYAKIMSGNLQGLSRVPAYRGKKLVVVGKLDLSRFPNVRNLGPIIEVTGTLDISGTEIASLVGVKTHGYVRDFNSKMWRIEKAREEAIIRAKAQSRREGGEWDDMENGYNVRAHALFEYLKGRDDLQDRPENLQEKIDELEDRKSQLEQMQAQLDDVSEEYDRLEGQIDAIDTEIEELNEGKYGDVYDLIPDGQMYGLPAFKSKLPDSEDEDYYIGDEDEVEEAFEDYWEQYVDDVGVDGFSQWLIDDNLDKDRLRSDIEDVYENDVRDNPESYLDESDRELSGKQEEQIRRLEDEKDELEEKLTGDDSDDEINDRISEIETEIEEINDSPEGDYKEDEIQEKIDSLVDYYLDNLDEFFGNMGYDKKDYLDKDGLVEYLVRNEDYGQMSSYDSSYDTINFNEETFYIFRHN